MSMIQAGFSLCIRSNYISNYNSTKMYVRGFKGHLLAMASKETPKKFYEAPGSSFIDSASCRLCGTVGDPNHRKDILKPSNRALLKIAEQLYGHNIVPDANLPRGVCRPCERRLKNCLEFQKVISQTQEGYKQRQQALRVKRSVDVSPSIARPPKSSKTSATKARTSLSSAFSAFEVLGEVVDVSSKSNVDIEVTAQLNKYFFLMLKLVLYCY